MLKKRIGGGIIGPNCVSDGSGLPRELIGYKTRFPVRKLGFGTDRRRDFGTFAAVG